MQTTSNSIKALRVLSGVALPVVGAGLVGRWVWEVLTTSTAPLRRGAPTGVDDALLASVAALALATLAWLATGMVLETLARAPGHVGRAAARASAAVSPLVVRRAAAVVIGAGLSAGLSPGVSLASPTASLAASIHVSASHTPGTSAIPLAGGATGGTADPGVGPLPHPGFAPLPEPGFAPLAALEPVPPLTHEPFVAERPVVRAQPDVRVITPSDRRATQRDPAREVVVHRGDSLWSIAARHLGREPSDAEIAREWPRWFAANRAAIGSDPDLLLPGQVLIAPEGSRS